MSDLVSEWHKKIKDDPNKTVVRETERLNILCDEKNKSKEINKMIRGQKPVTVCDQQTMLMETAINSFVEAGLTQAVNMRYEVLVELVAKLTPPKRKP